MILVIGGRSRTGRELILLLRAAGARLPVLTRAAETAGDPDVVPGDLARPATLDAAAAGSELAWAPALMICHRWGLPSGPDTGGSPGQRGQRRCPMA